MDPYLEARWSDVHATLIALLKEALQPMLPKDLRARTEERVLLETLEQERLGSFRSDIAVVRSPPGRAGRPSSATIGVEPFIVDFAAGPEIDRFVQIVDVANGNRVVTAIEVLSPWNKGPGRLNVDYCRKLDEYARAQVSVVEIDLLRGSRGRLPVGQEDLPIERRTPYLVCIRRGWQPSRWELYPVSLRERLPDIPIPLREHEADVVVPLQPILDRVYVAGGHDDIDYRRPPAPRLEGEDAAWADRLLKDVSFGDTSA